MLIDTFLPQRDISLVRTRLVEAEPSTVYDGILDAEIAEHPILRAANWLRGLPAMAEAVVSGEPQPDVGPRRKTIQDLVDDTPWTLLGKDQGEEVVIGVAGHLWNPADPELISVEPEAFAKFDEPGQAQVVLGISVRPYNEHRSLATAELRAKATDPKASDRLLRAWPILRPAATAALRVVLTSLRDRAESRRDIQLEEIEEPPSSRPPV